jgi:hypothetical protein
MEMWNERSACSRRVSPLRLGGVRSSTESGCLGCIPTVKRYDYSGKAAEPMSWPRMPDCAPTRSAFSECVILLLLLLDILIAHLIESGSRATCLPHGGNKQWHERRPMRTASTSSR